MEVLELIPFLVNAVPVAYWVTIGHVFTYATLTLTALHIALVVVNKLDLRDGVLDYPHVQAALDWLRFALPYVIGVVELLPLPRVPLVEGLRRLRALAAKPHPDDAGGAL